VQRPREATLRNRALEVIVRGEDSGEVLGERCADGDAIIEVLKGEIEHDVAAGDFASCRHIAAENRLARPAARAADRAIGLQ